MGTCSFEASDASGDSAIDPELRAGLAAAGRGAVVAGKSAALAHGLDLITTVATHEFGVPKNRSHRVQDSLCAVRIFARTRSRRSTACA